VISDDLSTILSAFIGPPYVPKPVLLGFLMLEFELMLDNIVDNFDPPELSFPRFIDYDGKGGLPLPPNYDLSRDPLLSCSLCLIS
jgi:hypothetical protein